MKLSRSHLRSIGAKLAVAAPLLFGAAGAAHADSSPDFQPTDATSCTADVLREMLSTTDASAKDSPHYTLGDKATQTVIATGDSPGLGKVRVHASNNGEKADLNIMASEGNNNAEINVSTNDKVRLGGVSFANGAYLDNAQQFARDLKTRVNKCLRDPAP